MAGVSGLLPLWCGLGRIGVERVGPAAPGKGQRPEGVLVIEVLAEFVEQDDGGLEDLAGLRLLLRIWYSTFAQFEEDLALESEQHAAFEGRLVLGLGSGELLGHRFEALDGRIEQLFSP